MTFRFYDPEGVIEITIPDDVPVVQALRQAMAKAEAIQMERRRLRAKVVALD